MNDLEFETLYSVTIQELKKVYEHGKIQLTDDTALSGLLLELRVKQLFSDITLDVRESRAPNLENITIQPSAEFRTKKPIVVEIKSSKYPQVSRSDLRQLDDWVYELSGEEIARKQGLKPELVGMQTFPWYEVFTKPGRHPYPHKGVMIFNGPLGIPFEERGECLNSESIQFVDKRDS